MDRQSRIGGAWEAAAFQYQGTTRGRGMIVQAGAAAPDPVAAGAQSPRQLNVRPAYRNSNGVQVPVAPPEGGPGHPLLDLSTVSGWRLVWVGVAVAYIVGFHVTLNGFRVGLGPAAR